MHGFLVTGLRLKDAEIFEIGKHREADLCAHRRNLQLREDQPETFDGTDA